jgi:predicted secreted Zn-dependent protease
MKILVLLFCFLFSLPPTTDKIKMRWREDRKLTWDDFRGRPSGSPEYVASTNSGISFSYSYSTKNDKVILEYNVQSNFYPELSWYRNGIVTDYILKHEQTHFDISELYARKLRKKIEEAIFTKNIKEELDAIYSENERQRQQTQHKYDRETEHSKLAEKEFQWRLYVAQELKKYERWM